MDRPKSRCPRIVPAVALRCQRCPRTVPGFPTYLQATVNRARAGVRHSGTGSKTRRIPPNDSGRRLCGHLCSETKNTVTSRACNSRFGLTSYVHWRYKPRVVGKSPNLPHTPHGCKNSRPPRFEYETSSQVTTAVSQASFPIESPTRWEAGQASAAMFGEATRGA